MHSPPLIAIVDDDEGVRCSLASLLRSLGYAVGIYGSARAFLDADPQHAPDCLILDMQMPGMTGEALQARLVQAGRWFPVIAMTAVPSKCARQRVLRAGALAYLSKPLDGDLIARCVADALGGAPPR